VLEDVALLLRGSEAPFELLDTTLERKELLRWRRGRFVRQRVLPGL